MKASVVTAYGGPEVMKYQDMPISSGAARAEMPTR
jgi:hypothetical protein